MRKMKALMLCLALMLVSITSQSATAQATEYEEDGSIGTRETAVTLNVETFTIRLPKTIDAVSSVVDYEVGVKGSLAEGCSLYIKPVESFVLTNELGLTATATVVQDKITWMPSEITAEEYNCGNGTITASLAVGTYAGIMQFEIGVKIPGLYGTDGSFTPWSTLISNGAVTVSDAIITRYSTGISGDLVLPTGVQTIDNGVGDEQTNISKIFLPNSITQFRTCFTNCRNLVFEYDGKSYTFDERGSLISALRANNVDVTKYFWTCD